MRAVSSALQAFLLSGQPHFSASLITIELASGGTIYMNTLDAPITYGGNVYQATGAGEDSAGVAAAMLGGEGCHHVDVTPKATRKATKPAHAKHAKPRSTRPAVPLSLTMVDAGTGDGLLDWPASSLSSDTEEAIEGCICVCIAVSRVMPVTGPTCSARNFECPSSDECEIRLLQIT